MILVLEDIVLREQFQQSLAFHVTVLFMHDSWLKIFVFNISIYLFHSLFREYLVFVF